MKNDQHHHRLRRSVVATAITGAVVAIAASTAFSAQASPAGVVADPSTSGGSLISVGSTGGASDGSLLGIGGTPAGTDSGSSGVLGAQVGSGTASVTVGGPTGDGLGVDCPPASPAPTETPAASAPPVAAAPELTRISLERSVGVVFPCKDGYRDSVSFLVEGVTSTGAVTAVRGTATLTRGATLVTTWKLTRSTQTLVWNGRVGTTVKTGTYLLRVAEWVGGGAVSKATTTVRVSADALVSRTRSIATDLDVRTVKNSMPAVVRRAYARGKVFVQVQTVVTRLSGPAYLTFVHGTHEKRRPLRLGTHTDRKTELPNDESFRTVTFRHDWKRGAVTVKAIRVIWTYHVLEQPVATTSHSDAAARATSSVL